MAWTGQESAAAWTSKRSASSYSASYSSLSASFMRNTWGAANTHCAWSSQMLMSTLTWGMVAFSLYVRQVVGAGAGPARSAGRPGFPGPGRERRVQVDQAVDCLDGVVPVDPAVVDLVVRQPPEHFPDHHPELHPGDVLPEAAVHP